MVRFASIEGSLNMVAQISIINIVQQIALLISSSLINNGGSYDFRILTADKRLLVVCFREYVWGEWGVYSAYTLQCT
jgi:hypothetical protein